MEMKNGYIALHVVSGTMRTVFKSNLSHSVILLDYNNRLYYLQITCYIKFHVFYKRFHKSSELWLKFLLLHKGLHNNTEYY